MWVEPGEENPKKESQAFKTSVHTAAHTAA